MIPRFVLDTDTVIDLINGVSGVIAQFQARSPDDLAITAITVSELRFGAVASEDTQRGMGDTAAVISELKVLPFGLPEALLHAELRFALRHKPISPNDMIVAATTLAVPAVLVSSNLREYNRVPNLRVESWR